MSPRTAVVVQARVGSTRLPGKVLLPMRGRAVLTCMLERLRAVLTPVELVVATSWQAIDDPIEALCHAADVRCVRGHPTDLVERHLQAAREVRAEVVVKIPSDCPLIDPEVVDRVIQRFHHSSRALDYASNLHPTSWPDGNDVEVMTMDALSIVHSEARRPFEREHTTPYLWDRPERFVIENVVDDHGRDRSSTHRLTLDYLEDYQVIRTVHEALWSADWVYGAEEIVAYLDAHPAVNGRNAIRRGVSWMHDHIEELQTIRSSLERKERST